VLPSVVCLIIPEKSSYEYNNYIRNQEEHHEKEIPIAEDKKTGNTKLSWFW